MKSNIKDDKYEILLEGERYPLRVNKKETDEILNELQSSIHIVREIIKKSTSNELRPLLHIFKDYLEINDYDNWQLKNFEEAIIDTQKQLQNGRDYIPSEDEIVTLEDLGYRKDSASEDYYTLPIEDTDEHEIVEEIFLRNPIIHRRRIIEWEKKHYNRSSKDIKYEYLLIDDKLEKAIKNTQKMIDKQSIS